MFSSIIYIQQTNNKLIEFARYISNCQFQLIPLEELASQCLQPTQEDVFKFPRLEVECL